MKDTLYLEGIDAGYFKREVLHNVNMKIKKNTILLLVGPNGAGKSTLLKVIAGMLKPWKGKAYFEGRELDGISCAQRAKIGISYFLQGGEIFGDLTVKENLEIASLEISKKKFEDKVDTVFALFPKLRDIKIRRAGLLSGGEKHQLAIGMIFIREPKLLLLDEPSAGLSPLLVKEILEKIKKMKEILNTSILLVEQNVREGMKIADTVYLMKAGSIIGEVAPKDLSKEGFFEKLFFD